MLVVLIGYQAVSADCYGGGTVNVNLGDVFRRVEGAEGDSVVSLFVVVDTESDGGTIRGEVYRFREGICTIAGCEEFVPPSVLRKSWRMMF